MSTGTLPRTAPGTRRQRRLPTTTAVLFVVLAAVSDIDFRRRDPLLALEGVVDWQIRIELAVWALAAGVVAWQMLHDRTWTVRRFPADMGPSAQVFLLVAVVALLSTLRLASALSTVRALQLVTLVMLVALTAREQHDDDRRRQWWLLFRRVFVAVVATLMTASLLLPGLRFDVVTHTGFSRLTIFYSHPITTGAFLGLAAVLLTGAMLAVHDPWLRRPFPLLAAGGGVATLFVLVLATRARGPILATAFAIGIIVIGSRDRTRRAVAVLAAAVLLAAVVGGAFDDQLSGALVRGQSQEEIFSLTGRIELFRYAGSLFAERPLFGYGYLASRSIYLDRFFWAGESHNAAVDIAISLGIVGLVLYGLLFWSIGVSLRSGRRRTRAEIVPEGWALMVFLLTMGVIGESFAGSAGVEVVALGVLALVADWVRRRTTTTSPSAAAA